MVIAFALAVFYLPHPDMYFGLFLVFFMFKTIVSFVCIPQTIEIHECKTTGEEKRQLSFPRNDCLYASSL